MLKKLIIITPFLAYSCASQAQDSYLKQLMVSKLINQSALDGAGRSVTNYEVEIDLYGGDDKRGVLIAAYANAWQFIDKFVKDRKIKDSKWSISITFIDKYHNKYGQEQRDRAITSSFNSDEYARSDFRNIGSFQAMDLLPVSTFSARGLDYSQEFCNSKVSLRKSPDFCARVASYTSQLSK